VNVKVFVKDVLISTWIDELVEHTVQSQKKVMFSKTNGVNHDN